MKKIESIIRTSKLSEVRNALNKYDIKGLTVSQVMGCGRQKGHKEYYRGSVVNINFLPKVKIEIVTKDKYVDEIIELISSVARTGEIGDGKIFVFDIEDAYRIRTGERGEDAL
jgi:nitrogen regulatory protein PII